MSYKILSDNLYITTFKECWKLIAEAFSTSCRHYENDIFIRHNCINCFMLEWAKFIQFEDQIQYFFHLLRPWET